MKALAEKHQIKTPAATKSAIRRASLKAQRTMNRFDDAVRKDLTRLYKQTIANLSQDIHLASSQQGDVSLNVLQRLLNQANKTLATLENSRDGLLASGINTAVNTGGGVFAIESAVLTNSLTNLATDAARAARDFIAADGLQLSDRIWRVDAHAQRVVKEAIEQSVLQGHSASQAASEFLARGQAVPGDIINKTKAAQASKIINKINQSLLKDKGSPLNNALRLFRTEINRAHGLAYQNTAFSHPDVVGTRFLLSPNHPKPDICDMHAKVNRYGLGAGVYPQGKSPWPAHPNTLSYESTVWIEDITEADKKGKQTRIDWLNDQSTVIQENVLGSRKKRWALDRGLLVEGQIATPWKILKKRYEAKGSFPDKWRAPAILNPVIKPKPHQTASVSAALNVQGQKKAVNETLSAIDSVHTDGQLPLIPVKASSGRRTLGSYRHYLRSGEAASISVSSKGTHKSLTAAHEIGHFIDHQAIADKGRFASDYHPIMEPWWEQVQKSKAYQSIQGLVKGPRVIEFEAGNYLIDKKHARYLLRRHELWARSYAQYIAQKSKSTVLKSELNNILSSQQKAQVSYHHQWQESDFKSIENAIDELMEALKWTK